MPAQAIPFVCAVVAMFLAFIVVVGGVALWTAVPFKRRDPDAPQTPSRPPR